MNCFIVPRQPKSYNTWKKNSAKGQNYLSDIHDSFKKIYEEHQLLTGDLYGSIYYFFKKDLHNDADNMSKPVWDCLINFLYDDDKQVKLRIAGSFDLGKNDFNELDFSSIPGKVIGEFLEAYDNHDHFLYIECGTLKSSFFKFSIEGNGN